MATLLFVYGTLLDPRRLTDLLGSLRWRWMGSGTVRGKLYDTGPYPALKLSDNEFERVPGKLVLLEKGEAALARLDAYEDAVAESLFRRQRVMVQLAGGESIEAWVYVYVRDVNRFRRIRRWRFPPNRRFR